MLIKLLKKLENWIHIIYLPKIVVSHQVTPGDAGAIGGLHREGYHQLEKEFKLLGFVGEALKKPQKVEIEEPEKVSVDDFREIAEKSYSKSKSSDKSSKIQDEG